MSSRFAPTQRSMQAAALLGMSLDQPARPHQHDQPPPLLHAPPGLTIVTGPSGAGKTTLLRRLAAAERLRARPVVTINLEPHREPAPANRPLVDLFDGPVEEAMRCLARAGLAEGACFVRRPSELSTGQMFRLRLALAMAQIDQQPGAALFIDEFAASLDRFTALGVCALIRRFAEQAPEPRIVLATPREELVAPLVATRVVRLGEPPTAGNPETSESASPRLKSPPTPASAPPRCTISTGTMDDYLALAPLHYRAALPAMVVRILAARAGDTLAGVLVVSMPTLNGAWRRRAWPGEFTTGDKHEDARRLNDPLRGVRCVSRVIIEPRFRAAGLATRLVRAYLTDPLTQRTEAIAAMGKASSFFERAGMRRVELGVNHWDARLLDLLEQHGLRWWELASPRRAYAKAHRRIGPRLLERELKHWAKASRASRTGLRGTFDRMECFRRACARLTARPAAFVVDSRHQPPLTHTTPHPTERGINEHNQPGA